MRPRAPLPALQQAEEALLAPPRGRIVLRDRQRRGTRHTEVHYHVVLENDAEAGEW